MVKPADARLGRSCGGRGGAGKVLNGDMACEMRKVSVENGDAKLCENGMRDNPGIVLRQLRLILG